MYDDTESHGNEKTCGDSGNGGMGIVPVAINEMKNKSPVRTVTIVVDMDDERLLLRLVRRTNPDDDKNKVRNCNADIPKAMSSTVVVIMVESSKNKVVVVNEGDIVERDVERKEDVVGSVTSTMDDDDDDDDSDDIGTISKSEGLVLLIKRVLRHLINWVGFNDDDDGAHLWRMEEVVVEK